MALVLHRGSVKISGGILGGLCKIISKQKPGITQVAFISSKVLRQGRPPKPAPYDYKNKTYGPWAVYFDPMEQRFDENSKLITVDGLPGIGKNKFCKELAEELEMIHYPAMTFDSMYIDNQGFDYRTLNPKIPEEAQYFDLNDYFRNPKGINSTAIQVHMFMMRYLTYIDALAHIFNTGQGVVLDRSPWTDLVFAKAMRACGHISPLGFDYYWSCYNNCLHRLLRPHVSIYLDAPVEMAMANIEKRNRPNEKGSPALTTEFFTEIDKVYKDTVLPKLSRHAHLLIYDWQEEGFLDDIIDDIEALNCEPADYDRGDEKLIDWRFNSIDETRGARSYYTNNKETLMYQILINRWDVPEMIRSAESNIKRDEVLEELYETEPGKEYDWGFDPYRDKGVLWKAYSCPKNVFNTKEEAPSAK